MKYYLIIFCILFITSCSKTTYYIVRHAEKATAAPNMSSDVPLRDAGKARANKLRDMLQDKNVGFIFSTQTIRTTSTATPLSDAISVPVQIYNHRDTMDLFIKRVKNITTKNVLIVGHSNTVDDLVNKLTGQSLLTDLQETEYDNFFIVKRSNKKFTIRKEKY